MRLPAALPEGPTVNSPIGRIHAMNYRAKSQRKCHNIED